MLINHNSICQEKLLNDLAESAQGSWRQSGMSAMVNHVQPQNKNLYKYLGYRPTENETHHDQGFTYFQASNKKNTVLMEPEQILKIMIRKSCPTTIKLLYYVQTDVYYVGGWCFLMLCFFYSNSCKKLYKLVYKNQYLINFFLEVQYLYISYSYSNA